jgi:D-beta-D-heptose 7-phosphate kinase/D-beta-D-heptose 1-phosphate adenosyltransferase
MIIDYKDLPEIRTANAGKKIVLATGSFDILHAGHALFFEDCKSLGDILVLGVGEDKALKLKGEDRPILNQYIRVKMVDSQKPVDFAFIHDTAEDDSGHDNSFLTRILENLKPDIWVVNQDASEIEYRQELANMHGVELKVLERVCPPEYDNVSTTKIINKIRSLK